MHNVVSFFDFQNELHNEHNGNICREIRVMFENKVLNRIGNSYLNDDDAINLFMGSNVYALNDVSLLLFP